MLKVGNSVYYYFVCVESWKFCILRTIFCVLKVGNSVYYNYDLSVNGKREKHGSTYPSDYLTDVIVSTCTKFTIFISVSQV